jgi:hypothetical protein
MNVTVTTTDLVYARDEGTVLVVTGTDEDTRDLVTFGVDHRVFSGLYNAANDDEDSQVTAQVEPWQVLYRQPVRRAVVHEPGYEFGQAGPAARSFADDGEYPVNDLGGQDPYPRFGAGENDLDEEVHDDLVDGEGAE